MYHMNHNMMPGMIEQSSDETKPESIDDTSAMPATMTDSETDRASDKK